MGEQGNERGCRKEGQQDREREVMGYCKCAGEGKRRRFSLCVRGVQDNTRREKEHAVEGGGNCSERPHVSMAIYSTCIRDLT